MKSNRILLGVLAGAAAGAALGMLLTSEKGSKARKAINEKVDDYADVLKEKVNDFLEGLADKYASTKDDVKGAASDFANQAKSKADEARNAMR